MNQNSRNRINELRQEYESIPVPAEARERVLAGISRAKKEQKRSIIMKLTKRTGAGAAAAMLAIVLLTNANPSIAHAMEQLPLIGPIAKVVTFRTYEDKTNHFEADIQMPQVIPESEEPAAVAANRSVEEYAEELIAMYEQELRDSEGQGNYSLTSSYQVVTDTQRYLSIRVDTLLVMASGTEFTKVFTVDKTTGQVVSLAHFLEDDAAKLEAVSDNIKEQMVSQMAEDDSIIYFYQSDMPEWDFKGLTGEESFYLDENGQLVVAFDEYTVAPGYMGAVEFTIPKSVTGEFS